MIKNSLFGLMLGAAVLSSAGAGIGVAMAATAAPEVSARTEPAASRHVQLAGYWTPYGYVRTCGFYATPFGVYRVCG